MRSLIITIERPFPPISGAELRNWAQAQALACLGPVTLAYLEPRVITAQPEEPIALVPLAPEETGPIWGDPRQRRTPLDLALTPLRLTAVKELLAQDKPDLVLLEGTPLYPLIPLARATGARLVMDFHNVESALLDQLQEAARPAWLRPLFGWHHPGIAAIRSLERQIVQEVDDLWVCSPDDAARLPTGAARLCVIPNAAPGPIASLPRQPASHQTALFLGHLGYPPNQTAARFLLQQVAPRCPSVRFLIAGRGARVLRKVPVGDNAEVIGDPPEVTPLYDKATVALLPLTSGGGTRIKALEAMAHGLPMIATARALEGLGLEPTRDYLRAESPAAFQQALQRLASDPALYQRLSAAGLATVTARFSQARITALIAEALS